MPPHCDTMDGPVVKAAKAALEAGDVKLILPWAPKAAEHELGEAFEHAMSIRNTGDNSAEAIKVAERWLYETLVRLHRAGEGAPFDGLKPAGLDTGPVVPRAEKAVETGDASEVVKFLCHTIEEEVNERFKGAMALKKFDKDDVDAAREYVEAMLTFLLYSHGVYKFITSEKHHTEGGEDDKKAAGHAH